MSIYCKFGGCKNNSGMNLEGLRFYRFPKDEKRCQVWIKACQNKSLKEIPASRHYESSRICSDHFQEWCFINSTTKHRLVHNAIPNSPKPTPIQIRNTTLPVYVSCSIPRCLSKSHREIEHSTAVGEKHILMFPVPHADTELFHKWKEAFKDAEIELTRDDHICEHHFLESDIERYHNIITPDDDIIKIPKKHPTLKPDAVPMNILKPSLRKDTSEEIVFQHHFLGNLIEKHNGIKVPDADVIEIPKKLPTLKPDAVPVEFLKSTCLITKDSSQEIVSSSKNSILKGLLLRSEEDLPYNSNLAINSSDSKNNVVGSENENFCDRAVDNVTNLGDSSVSSVEGQISHTKKYLPYSELVESIQLVKKPSEFWSVVCTYQFTIFARWNTKFIPEKRLVIENPFAVRVFLKDWEIEITDLIDITSVDDISLLLEKVEDYKFDVSC